MSKDYSIENLKVKNVKIPLNKYLFAIHSLAKNYMLSQSERCDLEVTETFLRKNKKILVTINLFDDFNIAYEILRNDMNFMNLFKYGYRIKSPYNNFRLENNQKYLKPKHEEEVNTHYYIFLANYILISHKEKFSPNELADLEVSKINAGLDKPYDEDEQRDHYVIIDHSEIAYLVIE